LSWSGKTIVIAMPNDLKDLNELHRDDPDRFRERLQEAMSAGTPLSMEGTKVDDAEGRVDSERFKLTDLGNAERLVDQFGNRIRYVAQWGWMVWEGGRWRRDDGNLRIARFASLTVRSMYSEAGELEDSGARNELIKHARSSEARPRLEAMIQLAKQFVLAE